MNTRRTFLTDVMGGSAAAVAGLVTLRSDAMARVRAASQAIEGRSAAEIARNESERKLERLRSLKDRWARRLEKQPRVKLLTSFEPEMAGCLAMVGIEGIDPGRITTHLWDRYRIIVTPIGHAEYQGVRVTPNVYTTLEEIDSFSAAMEALAVNGLPRH